MPVTTSLAIGCQLKSKASGIVYTKTGPDRWNPTANDLIFDWQAFHSSDAVVLASSDMLPVAIRGHKRKHA